jgi:two-component system KDP operon response regulator KdpE
MQGKKILVVDDDAGMCELLKLVLSREGAQVFTASGGHEGLLQFFTCQPDLVILDIMMPNVDGWQLCTEIRELADVPIIFLSALREENEIVRGLELGAADYVTKPFEAKVLVARARAVLRQVARPPASQERHAPSTVHSTIDLDGHRAVVNGKPVKLTPTERRLLAYLLKNSGQVLTFQQILRKIWGNAYEHNSEYVHVHMSRLRQKLEADPRHPRHILTEYGLGYRFEPHPSGQERRHDEEN